MALIEIIRGTDNVELTAEEFRMEQWSSKMSISESISTGKSSSIAVLVSVSVLVSKVILIYRQLPSPDLTYMHPV